MSISITVKLSNGRNIELTQQEFNELKQQLNNYKIESNDRFCYDDNHHSEIVKRMLDNLKPDKTINPPTFDCVTTI